MGDEVRAKFTPGPWDFDRDIWWKNTPGEQEQHGGLIVFPSDNDDLTVADVNDCFDKGVGRANACLIAAAPDLYDALIAMVEGGEVSFKKLSRARCALEKARGEKGVTK